MVEVTKEEIAEWFKGLQDSICSSLENLDGISNFVEDKWRRAEGGGGRSRVIKDGDLIEKGGVNFSAVSGPTPIKILNALNLPESEFFATGVSIVLHPQNPWVPIIHMNVRYFEMSNGVWWFGGGIDLTPHYVIPEKAKAFHYYMKNTCDKHNSEFYPKFKEWADDYFFVKHRNETRGIGGIFFDRLNDNDGRSKSDQWHFVQDIGETFIPAYTDAVRDLRNKKWNKEDKNWQKIRRGRYVEFNLVHDKGTKFGLDTNGRTESILMSMPPEANWEYDHQPTNDLQKETIKYLNKGLNWI
ncbi:coproporphyrinogen oxidase [Ekhidna lutea]|uniref:coproporphyrinogen oxidase n=1 Tax=Ekhidna lutea TaxID=447679 RepID=A0A239M802_EKHLU|nr:oxygen-dependent coproporphyrinogen oxidase [Ekhidna lutea]SNT38761.1 coproporphyrinogen oxidase [Ekhidna lutea]